MPDFRLSFSSSYTFDQSSYKLLELPSELSKLVEESLKSNHPLRFDIKGESVDDAVLCTNDRTYALRSVVLSNSIVVATAPPFSSTIDFPDETLVIRDQVNEILELTPVVPKLHKLKTFLRGSEYSEDHEEDDMEDDGEQVLISQKPSKLTYSDAKSLIQASNVELDHGLREKRILQVNGQLRPIALSYLGRIIEILLNTLVSHSIDYKAASVERITAMLLEEHEIPRPISLQVISWFGTTEGDNWCMDVLSVIKESGLTLLRRHKTDSISVEQFTASWKAMVGDTFASEVSLKLLAGNYLLSSGFDGTDILTYFPASSLPTEPAPRFADLFLTRSRWRSEDIAPFLSDIAVDTKERDKLLLKYARATTTSDGIWYTSRTQYNG
ncbi:hypothetical protein L218DRAFT_854083 [Marasmius fiardii PR-910]|nr:hypothetical protein L218DRAFT_854083 [Marasmius fiardii PR-910]